MFTLLIFIPINLPTHDERLVHPRDNIHHPVMMGDYSEFLLHVSEFQLTIRTLLYFDGLLLLSL